MTLAGYNLQDNVYIYSNNKCMCVFLISPVPIAEPLTSELIDTPVFYNLAPRPIKYRVSVPIPSRHTAFLYRRRIRTSTLPSAKHFRSTHVFALPVWEHIRPETFDGRRVPCKMRSVISQAFVRHFILCLRAKFLNAV